MPLRQGEQGPQVFIIKNIFTLPWNIKMVRNIGFRETRQILRGKSPKMLAITLTPGARFQGRVRQPVEGLAVGAERRAEVPRRPVAHPGHAQVQARAALHPGRGGRRARLVAHPEHRPHAQDALQGVTGVNVISCFEFSTNVTINFLHHQADGNLFANYVGGTIEKIKRIGRNSHC
jgi:hypothetical protein